MNRFFLSLFFLPLFLSADLDHFFSGTEDPVMVHHVNVLSGHLNLAFQDVTAQGALSIPLNRTYSSRGAFQSPEFLKYLPEGWTVAYGWKLMPHTRLSIFSHSDRSGYKAFTTESNGT